MDPKGEENITQAEAQEFADQNELHYVVDMDKLDDPQDLIKSGLVYQYLAFGKFKDP